MNIVDSSPPLPASNSNSPAPLELNVHKNEPYEPTQTSSWIDEFLADDDSTIYTYFSTESSNYTMSNLPGPGRLLGNLFSSAGSTLERSLKKLACRTGLGSFAKARKVLNRESPAWDDRYRYTGHPPLTIDEKIHVLNTFLTYAKCVLSFFC